MYLGEGHLKFDVACIGKLKSTPGIGTKSHNLVLVSESLQSEENKLTTWISQTFEYIHIKM